MFRFFPKFAITAAALGAAMVCPLAGAITVDLSQGSQFDSLTGGSADDMVTLTPDVSVQVVVSATSNSDNTATGGNVADLRRSGGGGQSGAGIQSTGANSSNDGSTIELVGNQSTLDETITLSFLDGSGDPVAVNLFSFLAAHFQTGETLSAIVGASGTQAFASSASNNAQNTYNFAASTSLAAGDSLSFKSTNGSFRLSSVDFELVPEPASMLLVGAGLALMAGRRRRA